MLYNKIEVDDLGQQTESLASCQHSWPLFSSSKPVKPHNSFPEHNFLQFKILPYWINMVSASYFFHGKFSQKA